MKRKTPKPRHYMAAALGNGQFGQRIIPDKRKKEKNKRLSRKKILEGL